MKSFNNAQSCEVNINVKSYRTFSDGQKLGSDITANIKQVNIGEEDAEMASVAGGYDLGQTYDAKTYYKDGYFYISMEGKKVKMHMPLEEVAGISDIPAPINDWPESTIKNQQVKGNTLYFTLDGSALSSFIDISSLGSSDDGTGPDDMDIGDIHITVILDNNELNTLNYNLSVKIVENGQPVIISYDRTMKVTKIDNITITFPSDLDSYEEI